MSEAEKNEMALEALKWIVHDIDERKAEADKEAENNHDEFSEGRKLAYFEVTDMIKARLDVLNIKGA